MGLTRSATEVAPEFGRAHGHTTDYGHVDIFGGAVAIEGKTSKGTKVREIMTAEVIYVEPSCDVEEALALMTDRRIRHLPVVDGDSLKGLVSIGDLVRFQTKEQSFQIRYLEEYISAR